MPSVKPSAFRRRPSAPILVVALLLAGCGKGMSDPVPNPPSNPPQCDTSVRRCAHAFAYGPMTLNGHEKAVTLIGDYRTDSWTNGDAATFDGMKWVVTVPVPWATKVTYKFHVAYDNGMADAYVPDPSNPQQVDDGFGGKNSVYAGTTCDAWTCASTRISCSVTPLSPTSFDWRDAVIYWAFVDRF